MAAQVSTPEPHPAEATAAVVEAKTLDARSEAIKLIEARASEAEPADENASAPDASTADSVPEAPKPAEESEDPRVAKRIAAALKAERRAEQRREEQAAKEAKLVERERELDARLKELEARAETFRLLETDPVQAFDKLKLDPKTFLERLAGEHDPSKVIERQIASEREARLALEKRLEEERAARQQSEREAMRAQQEAHVRVAVQTASAAFIGMLEQNAEKYPYLADEYTPEEITDRALAVASQHGEAYKREFGEYPDDEVIADYLEAEARKRAEARSAWRSRLMKTPEPGKGTASASALKPRTLTNGAASTKATAPKPWSEKDARDEAMKIIRQMHASTDSD